MNNTRHNIQRAVLETLEDRRLLSGVTYMDGVLTLLGDAHSANTLKVTLSADGRNIFGLANNAVRSVQLDRVSEIRIVGGDGNDAITVDPRLKIGVRIEAGAGRDTILGGAGNDTIISSGGEDLIDGRGGNDEIRNGQLSQAPPIAHVPDHPSTPPPTKAPEAPVETPKTPVGPTKPTTPSTPSGPVAPPPVVSPTTPDPLAPSAAISHLASSFMVGSAVHVHGLDSTLRSGDVMSNRFEWDFGDSGSAYNNLTGWNAAHVYDKAGTYTITLTVTDAQGRSNTTSMQVNINADARYTIYVDRNGNDANNGLHPDQAVKTVERAMQLLGDNTRLAFKRGQQWDMTEGVWIASSNVVIDAYGAGDNPVLRWMRPTYGVMINLDAGVNSVTIQNLTFDSMRTGDTSEENMVHAISPRGSNVTVRNNTFLNVGYAINANGRPTGLLVQDNTAPLETGLRGYFTWFEGTDAVFLGNQVANSTRQHIVRMRWYTRVLFAHNDFTNLDRRSAGDVADTAKGSISANEGQYLYVTHNTVQGGGIGFGPLGADNVVADARTRWSVIENNLLNSAHIGVAAGSEHGRIEGNQIYANGFTAVSVAGAVTEYSRNVNDIQILNNVAINQGKNGNFLTVGKDSRGITLVGNTYYAPNLQVGDADHSAINIYDTKVDALVKVDANIWAVQAGTYIPGSFIFAGMGWSGKGLYTAERWNSLAQVGDDVFINLRTDTYIVDLQKLVGRVGA